MNDAEVATLSPNTSIEHVGSSAQVMRAGTVLSRDLMQLLAAEVATTAERERNRRLLTVVGVAGIAAISVVFAKREGSPVEGLNRVAGLREPLAARSSGMSLGVKNLIHISSPIAMTPIAGRTCRCARRST